MKENSCSACLPDMLVLAAIVLPAQRSHPRTAEDRRSHSAERPRPAPRRRASCWCYPEQAQGPNRPGAPIHSGGNLAPGVDGQAPRARYRRSQQDMTLFSPEKLKQFDAICFNNTGGMA